MNNVKRIPQVPERNTLMASASVAATSNTIESQSGSRLRGFALVSVLTALMLTLFLEALDQAIVGTAMPRIVAQLHGLDRYSWVVTAYILASITMIPVVGKLSDQFGRKWFLLSGTALFLLGSALAGAAQSMDQLIAFRALQGLGAGIGMALVATVIGDLFPPEERAKWMGLFGVVYGVSTLCGPTLGGWLTEHGPLVGGLIVESSRWRWVFYFNLPIGVLAVAALVVFLPADVSGVVGAFNWAAARRIDAQGAALSAAATISLMLGLTIGSNRLLAWDSPQVIGLLLAGVVLFALFIRAERRAAEPILPLDLFRNRAFTASALLALIQAMVLLGLTLYLPLFLQGALGVSPTDAGLIMTPFSVSMVVGAMLCSTAIDKLKRYRIVAIVAAGLMSVGAFLITLMTVSTSVGVAIVFLVLTGLGAGAFFTLPMLVAQNALPSSQLGVSTAAVRYLGQWGAVLGIALVGAVVTSGVSGDLTQHLPTSLAGKVALSGALQHGFVVVLVFALVALAVACWMKDAPIVKANAEVDSAAFAASEARDEAVDEEALELLSA